MTPASGWSPVTLPALVLRGTRYSAVKAYDAALLADRLFRGKLRELPGAGHLAVIERPDEIARQIEVFVRRSEAHSLMGAGRITASQALAETLTPVRYRGGRVEGPERDAPAVG